jgi:hypothetical protein
MTAPQAKPMPRTRWLAAAVAAGLAAVILPAAVASSRAVPDWAGMVLLAAILGIASAAAGYRAPSRGAALAFAVTASATVVALLAILISLRVRGGGKVEPVTTIAAITAMVGIPAELFCVAIAWIAHATPGSRRRRASPAGFCPHCGYDKRALPTARCPECGA